MKITFNSLFAIVFLQAFYFFSFGQDNFQDPSYKINVRIAPASGKIECRIEIENPSDSCFILNKDMGIDNISADGASVSYQKYDTDILPNSAIFNIGSPIPKNLIIEYSGEIKSEAFRPEIRNVNMIKPELVELATYVSWYPRLMHNKNSFNFQINIDLPSDFSAVTNGYLIDEKIESDHLFSEWKSFKPCSDILILAAPNLKKSEVTKDGTKIEIYYDKLPLTYIDSMESNLFKSMEWLTNLLGTSRSDNLIRVGYSPRPAWGYVRAPFIVVSENFALYGRSQKFGSARDFRYITHEISHYWWSLANTNSPDDWINEGLAEYSAFLISEDVIGKKFTDQLLKEYNERAENCVTETAIAETENNSPDREVNRYAKPVLIFNKAREKYGDETMKRFYKNLYDRFLESKDATTAVFLDEAEKQIGKEAKDYFSEALYKKNWHDKKSIAPNLNLKINPIFFGTWNGELIQMDMKMKVVLHITGKDGSLQAKMDSPDQGVKDIPVSEIIINNDSLIFKIGAAAAGFEGILDQKEMTIAGKWNQAGAAYPLKLFKNN